MLHEFKSLYSFINGSLFWISLNRNLFCFLIILKCLFYFVLFFNHSRVDFALVEGPKLFGLYDA